jgi:hypothetical protein
VASVQRDHQEEDTLFTIILDGESVSMEDFWEIQRDISVLLDEVDKQAFQKERTSINWRISTVSTGSVHLTFAGIPAYRATAITDVSLLIDKIQSGIATLSEKAERPQFFSDRALKNLESLSKKLDNGVSVLRLGSTSRVVNITKEIARNVDQLIGAHYESYGSIEGLLDGIDIHRSPFFTLYTMLEDKSIKCYFDKNLQEQAISYLSKRVYTYGLIRSRRDGERISITVQEIELLAEEDELPTISEMAGILAEEK